MRAIGATGTWDVPEVWVKHNWQRPYVYMRTISGDSALDSADYAGHDYLFNKITSGFDCKRSLSRRSLTKTSGRGLENRHVRAILRSLYDAMIREPLLFAAVVTEDCGDWPDGYWLVDHSPRSLMRCPRRYDQQEVGRLIQGQAWAAGPGIGIVIGIEGSNMSDDCREFDYAKALVGCGRVGHAAVLEALHLGLSSRMTPAVHETTAQQIFDLEPDRDALYFLRIAFPAEETR